jgi:nucleoredoxin
MKTLPVLSILALLHLGAVAFAAENPIAPQLKNDLVALEGKKAHRFDDAALANTKYFGIYYSASWCGPCKQFTPKLVEFYNRVKPSNPDFELIFVSRDHSEPEMEAYMREDKMPWPALDFRKASSKHVLTSYRGSGIPCLVLIDANGKVLSHSYEGSNYVGPNKVMKDIEATLKSGGGSAAASDTVAPAASTGAAKGPASPQGSKFDDFFKKKTQ